MGGFQKITLVCVLLFVCTFSFAQSIPQEGKFETIDLPGFGNPVEVQAIAFEGGRLAAFAEVVGNLDKNVIATHFALKKNGSGEWIDLGVRKTPGFDVSVNPTIAVTAKGALLRVSMAAKNDLSEGILEFSSSTDQGTTWSEWKSIVTSKGSTPDKPWMVTTASGEVFVLYTELIPIKPFFKSDKPNSRQPFYTSLRIVYSKDNGQTWSTPEHVADVWELNDPTNSIGAQGGFITTDASRRRLYLSYSQYVRKDNTKTAAVFFAKRSRNKKWAKPISLTFNFADEKDINPPLTTLAVSPDGKNIILLVYAAHYYHSRPTAFVSRDRGTTWSTPIEFDEIMTPVSVTLDNNGKYSLLYAQATEQTINEEKGLNYEVIQTSGTLDVLVTSNQKTSKSCESKLKLVTQFLPQRPNAGQIYWGGYHSLLKNEAGSSEAYFIFPSPTDLSRTTIGVFTIPATPKNLSLF